MLSHMLDWRLFGADPAGHHATSVALHAANAALLFALLDATTGAPWRSALAAALFGLHPLRVESVAWVAERKDVLSTLFWLSTTLAYAAWVRRPTRGRYAAVAAGLALGLLAKPMLVTLPAALVLLDHWPLGRLRSARDLWPRVREKLPLLAIVAAASVATLVVQRRGGAVGSLDVYPLATRLGNAAVSYVAYLRAAAWPVDLAVLYPHPRTVSGGAVAASAALLALVTAAVLAARRRPYLLVGWLWYLGTLVPVIGLVQVGDVARADRYTYVPLIGVAVAVAWSLPAWPRLVAAAAAVVLAALALRTRDQIAVWRDSVALFSHALAVEERNPVAHGNLGYALAVRGETDRAIHHLERAVALRPDLLTARVELGNALHARGRVDEAAAHYAAAVALDGRSAPALTNLGRLLAERGRTAEAVALHERALAADPDSAAAHVNLGTALAGQGRTAEARRHFERAAALEPANAEAHNNLGNMLLAEGRTAEGLAAIDRALALRPGFGTAHANRAAALLLLGRPAEAWAAVRRARALGHEPAPALVRMLGERMPEPEGG
jgi:tetratricopeptide (TPR) repeat protein